MKRIMNRTAFAVLVVVFSFLLLGCDQILEVFYPDETKALAGEFVEVEAVVKFDPGFDIGSLGQNPVFIAAVPYNNFEGYETANWEGRIPQKFTDAEYDQVSGMMKVSGMFQLRRGKSYLLVAWQDNNHNDRIEAEEPSTQLYFPDVQNTDMGMTTRVFIGPDFPESATAVADGFRNETWYRLPESLLWEFYSGDTANLDIYGQWDVSSYDWWTVNAADAQDWYTGYYQFTRSSSLDMPAINSIIWKLKTEGGQTVYVDGQDQHTINLAYNQYSTWESIDVNFPGAMLNGTLVPYDTIGKLSLEVTIKYADGKSSTRNWWITFYSDYMPPPPEASDTTPYTVSVEVYDSGYGYYPNALVKVFLHDTAMGTDTEILSGSTDAGGYYFGTTPYTLPYHKSIHDTLVVKLDTDYDGFVDDELYFPQTDIYLESGMSDFYMYYTASDFQAPLY